MSQVQYSLTSIRGVGRRFSNLICKKAEVDPNKRSVLLTGLGAHWFVSFAARTRLPSSAPSAN